MLLPGRSWHVVFVVLAATALCVPSNAAGKPRIIPLRTSATFSAQFPDSRWSVPIKSTDGHTVYTLSLEPYRDVKNHIAGLDLELRFAHDMSDAPNLLEPVGRWHGLQAFNFAGTDFAQGAEKSGFGENRTIYVKRADLMVRIDVSKAVVSQVSTGEYQFDRLDLQIDVYNAPSGPRRSAASQLTTEN